MSLQASCKNRADKTKIIALSNKQSVQKCRDSNTNSFWFNFRRSKWKFDDWTGVYNWTDVYSSAPRPYTPTLQTTKKKKKHFANLYYWVWTWIQTFDDRLLSLLVRR